MYAHFKKKHILFLLLVKDVGVVKDLSDGGVLLLFIFVLISTSMAAWVLVAIFPLDLQHGSITPSPHLQ